MWKNTNFDSILKGYKRFCCNKCSRISNETKEKYKETCLKNMVSQVQIN